MTTKKTVPSKKIEDTILETLAVMEKIRNASERSLGAYQKALSKRDLMTIAEANKMRIEYLRHKQLHFEKFVELILQVRNAGNKRNGYQKRHFFSEVATYNEIKVEQRKLKEKLI
jgi:hypothetical protein